MSIEKKIRIQNLYDTQARWESVYESDSGELAVPKRGEIVIYDDNGIQKIKIGDGETALKDLRYAADMYQVLYGYESHEIFRYTPGELTIPSDRDAYKCLLIMKDVETLDSDKLENFTDVESVIFEKGNSIKELPENAFKDYINITNIQLPTSVTSIGSSSFSGCTKLSDIKLHSGITSIGDYAFSNTAIEYIQIPESVTSIGTSLFDLSKLSNLVIENLDVFIDMFDSNVLYLLWWILGPSCSTTLTKLVIHSFSEGKIPGIAFMSNLNSLAELSIPDITTKRIDGSKCTNIGALFNNKTNVIESNRYVPLSLKNITITKGSTIGDYAFSSSNIETVTLVETTEIGLYSFENCTSLKNIKLSKKLTTIDDLAFSGCSSLEGVEFPDTVTKVAVGCFYGCNNIRYIHFGKGLMSQCSDVSSTAQQYLCFPFWGCRSSKLSKITYTPDTTLNDKYQYMIDYSNGTLMGGSTRSGSYTDLLCSFYGSYIPNTGNIKICRMSFYNRDDLTSITLPNSVKSIEDSAFSGCTGLTSVVIPDSVTSISADAFSDCNNLLELTATTKVINILTIPNSIKKVVVINPEDKTLVETLSKEKFKDNTSLITFEGHLKNLNESLFEGCINLQTVTISAQSVYTPSIPIKCFKNCGSLRVFDTTNSLSKCVFSEECFYGCSMLTKIPKVSSENTSNFCVSCFEKSGIKSFDSPQLAIIESKAFSNCCDLSDVIITPISSNNISTDITISGDAFNNCSSLNSILIKTSPHRIKFNDASLMDQRLTILLDEGCLSSAYSMNLFTKDVGTKLISDQIEWDKIAYFSSEGSPKRAHLKEYISNGIYEVYITVGVTGGGLSDITNTNAWKTYVGKIYFGDPDLYSKDSIASRESLHVVMIPGSTQSGDCEEYLYWMPYALNIYPDLLNANSYYASLVTVNANGIVFNDEMSKYHTFKIGLRKVRN